MKKTKITLNKTYTESGHETSDNITKISCCTDKSAASWLNQTKPSADKSSHRSRNRTSTVSKSAVKRKLDVQDDESERSTRTRKSGSPSRNQNPLTTSKKTAITDQQLMKNKISSYLVRTERRTEIDPSHVPPRKKVEENSQAGLDPVENDPSSIETRVSEYSAEYDRVTQKKLRSITKDNNLPRENDPKENAYRMSVSVKGVVIEDMKTFLVKKK